MKLRDSHLSMYEVTTSGNPIKLTDILGDQGEIEIADEQLECLEEGYVFATRFIDSGEGKVMGIVRGPKGMEI